VFEAALILWCPKENNQRRKGAILRDSPRGLASTLNSKVSLKGQIKEI